MLAAPKVARAPMVQSDFLLVDVLQIKRWLYRWRFDLLLAFAVLWIGYGFLALGLNSTGDDWVALSDDSILIQYAVQNGRWIHAALMALQDHSRAAPAFTICLLLLAMLATVSLFAHALGLRNNGVVALFTVLAFCFPFWAEFVSFRILHLPGGIALFLSAGYGYLCWQTAARWHQGANLGSQIVGLALAALAFSFCAATYQGFLPVGCMLLAAYLLAALDAEHPSSGLPAGYLLKLALVVGIVLVFGAALYAIQVSLAERLTGVGPSPFPRYHLATSLVSNLQEASASVERLGRHLWAFFTQPNHLFPLWPKLVFAAFILTLIVRMFGVPGSAAKLQMLAVLAALVLAPWVLGLVRNPDSYRYNAIVCAGLIYAIVICHTLNRLQNVRVRQVAMCAAAAVALGFVFVQNSAALITHHNNARGMAVVVRLLDRITQVDGYGSLSRVAPVDVVVQGDFRLSDTRPFQANTAGDVLDSSNIDCSILRCSLGNLNYATRLATADDIKYRFVRYEVQSPSYQSALAPVFEQLKRWPERGALQVIDDTTILLRLAEPPQLSGSEPSNTNIVMLPISASEDGFVRLVDGVGAFGIAMSNPGATAVLYLSASLPEALSAGSISLCQTNPVTGACLGETTTDAQGREIVIGSEQQLSFAFFVGSSVDIPQDVLANRIIIRLTDLQGRVYSAASLAVVSTGIK